MSSLSSPLSSRVPAPAASRVRFLGPPSGPGQGLQPSCVSLGSPWQVGYGSQVPSSVQDDLISGPTGHWNSQTAPGQSREQYPGIPGHTPGTCSSTPGSCSMHRGMSVQVPSSWHSGTLFLPLEHTTEQVSPT